MNKISHDIRGPVATIKDMCILSQQEWKEPLALQYFKITEMHEEGCTELLLTIPQNFIPTLPSAKADQNIEDENEYTVLEDEKATA